MERRGRRYLISYLGELCVQDGVEHLVRALRILRDDLTATTFSASSSVAVRIREMS
ncbi:MAG: hypothetical protein M3083_24690 [Actinomycetota bacterium]|nr:hypothetical protein [Actinomycetota bacterium]